MDTSWKKSADLELLSSSAISAAVSSDWEQAIKINKKILKIQEKNVEALNRLAKALLCVGKFSQAKRIYNKVLAIDAYNIIATKNLEKISKSNGNNLASETAPIGEIGHSVNFSTLFLNEPGKTKLIKLLNLAPPQVIATLNCGDEVLLKTKTHSVAITSLREVYLGALPDDLAHRLITFIDGGNKYAAFVKSAAQKSIIVFIKEVFKSEKYANQPSFQYTPDIYSDEKTYKMY